MNRRTLIAWICTLSVVGMLATSAGTVRVEAGNAMAYTRNGTPFGWDNTQPVKFTPDRGTLGKLSNAQAVQLVSDLFNNWAKVPTATISFAQDGQLSVDVVGSNVMQVINSLPRTTNAIIFDTDGTVTDALLGASANLSIIGFAGPVRALSGSGRITQSRAVLNGRWIDGLPRPTDNSLAAFRADMTHEFGHFVGLDHSGVNLEEAFDGIGSNDKLVPVMFPFEIPSQTEDPKLDDMTALSAIYPKATQAASFGTIRGKIQYPNGISGFQGVEVIARKVGDPRNSAAGGISGNRFMGTVGGFGQGVSDLDQIGAYEIPWLPPGNYTVEIKGIPAEFKNGSREGPLDPPAEFPAPEEFYSGAAESNSDDPQLSAPVTVAAGGVVENINIIINGKTPANDECVNATPVTSTSFSTTQSTSYASTGLDDPLHNCGDDRDSNTVWYTFTAPTDGILSVDTSFSDYDTTLAVYQGDCGALTELGCSDDVSELDTSSTLTISATKGSKFFIEACDLDDGPGGGTLHFNLNFSAGALVGEQEPNNSVAQAQAVPIPSIIQGDVNRDDVGAVSVPVGTLTDDVEDLYKVSLTSPTNLSVTFEINAFVSSAMYVMKISGDQVTVLATSQGPGTVNLSGLAPGDYYVGVTNYDFDTSSPAAVYRLIVLAK